MIEIKVQKGSFFLWSGVGKLGKLMLKPLRKRKEKKKGRSCLENHWEARVLLALANMQIYYETSIIKTVWH